METAVQSSVVGTTTDDIPESNNDGDRSADGVSFDSNSIRIDEFEEDAVFKNKRIYTNIGMRGCKRRRHARLLESVSMRHLELKNSLHLKLKHTYADVTLIFY